MGESYESGLVKLHLVVTVLRRCHRALKYSMDDASLLADLCQILVTLAGYRFCWIGCFECNDPNHIRPVTCHGEEMTDICSWDEAGLRSATLLGTVLETNAPFRIQHLSAKDSPASGETWRTTAVNKGFQSALYLPLQTDENHPAIGIMALYSADPAGFNNKETALLSLLSRDIAQSLTRLSHKDVHPVSNTVPDSIHTNHDETIGLQNAALFFDY